MFTIFSPAGNPQDPALHPGVPAGALSCLLWLLLLQCHDGSATDAACLLGLPHFAHGPQVHNWKGEDYLLLLSTTELPKLHVMSVTL